MSLFYLCTELNCNKKYKTKDKLIGHLLEVHKIISPTIQDPAEITKDNRKVFENKRNNNKKQELREQQIKDIEKQKELEMIAKKESEEKFKQEQIEKYKIIESEKLRLEEAKLKLQEEENEINKKWLMAIDKISNHLNENSDDCCICGENKADTAIVPCGHKHFCYGCIGDYHKMYPKKGCPVCRNYIQNLMKIYS